MTTNRAEHVRASLSHLEAAKASRLALDEAYAASRQDRAEIAELHQRIGFGLKVAEIHALLALSAEDRPAPDFTTDHLPDLTAERFGTTSRLG